jgi:hypothetical protein
MMFTGATDMLNPVRVALPGFSFAAKGESPQHNPSPFSPFPIAVF